MVSTPAFIELQRYLDVVYVAETLGRFAQCIEKALAEDNYERATARSEKSREKYLGH